MFSIVLAALLSVSAPSFGCRNGEATAYVPPVDGATYAWSAEGATIVSGAGTNRVTLRLGNGTTAKVNVAVGADSASAVISLREPIEVRELVVPATADANQPVTIRWSYAPGREPVSQLLAGSALAQPVVLAAQQRSHTFTPKNSGSIELHASYANAIPLAAPRRRRASSGSAVAATECPAAKVTRSLEVRGCSAAEPQLDVPEDVEAGEVFAVTTDVGAGDKTEWSVEGGSVQSTSPFGESIVVVAGASGRLLVGVRITRAAGCIALASAEVPIIARQCTTAAPEAALSIIGRDCDSAIVQATFTGTPPFAGVWSDGTAFRSGAHTAVHEFHGGGDIAIRDFHDGSCFGVVRGATSLVRLQPSVTLSGSGACGNGTLTATFDGVPPFSGTWSDGESFTTSSTTLQRRVDAGDWSIVTLTDAACTTASVKSNTIRVAAGPRLRFDEPFCIAPGSSTSITPRITGGSPPYRVVWSDGVVSESSENVVQRRIPDSPEPVRTFEIVEATANGCEVALEAPVATLLRRDYAAGDHRGSTHCTATDSMLSLARTPSTPGAILTWTFMSPDVKLVSGQGTATPTVRAEKALKTYATITTTYPDGHCDFVDNYIPLEFRTQSNVNSAQAVPDTIARFGTSTLFLNVGGVPQSLTVTPTRGRITMSGCCTGYYTDTTGEPGTVHFIIQWSDPCLGERQMTTTLTVTP
ncbi:MAG TPA: hypothetical protein VF266_16305 [Thermoanaerobaculia bacterium]